MAVQYCGNQSLLLVIKVIGRLNLNMAYNHVTTCIMNPLIAHSVLLLCEVFVKRVR